MTHLRLLPALVLLLTLLPAVPALGQTTGWETAYDIGSPTLTDVWVDPQTGDDARSGASRDLAVRTVAEAWRRVPQALPLTTSGFRLMLVGGQYPESNLPVYMEQRYGTSAAPIVIQSADGRGAAELHGALNIFDTHYLYLIDLSFVTDPGADGGGNMVHIEQGDHILLRGDRLDGFDGTNRQPQETLKVNQSSAVFVEDSDIAGAFWFPLDFVAVQGGHVLNSRIHNAGEDCLLLKGGTSQVWVAGNEVSDCLIGLAAGQGSGVEFLVAPWLHYEAYDLTFVNNLVHDTRNAGLAVRGGRDIVFAFNTFQRVGSNPDGAPLVLLAPGMRGCDGHAEACRANHDAGAWGPSVPGDEDEYIPNAHVSIVDNVFDNPGPVRAEAFLDVFSPRTPPPGVNLDGPVRSDADVLIRGNVVWNGAGELPLGIGDDNQGCASNNPTCNATQLRADNALNGRDARIGQGGPAHRVPIGVTAVPVPAFPTGGRPTPVAPEGPRQPTVTHDFFGHARSPDGPPGAFAG